MGTLRFGVHRELESAADEFLRESLVGVTSQTAKRDILTPWKEKDRLRREVYVPSGVPEAASREGMYHRSYNPSSPHLNSRAGGVRSARVNSHDIRETYEGDKNGWSESGIGSEVQFGE